MKNKKRIGLILVFLFTLAIFTSCTAVNRRPEEPAPNAPRQTREIVPPTEPAPGARDNLRTPEVTPTPGAPMVPGTPQTPAPPQNQGPAPGPGLRRPMPRDGQQGLRTPQTGADTNLTRRAERIAARVANQNEIESATCIVTGNTAMIGVQFNRQYKGKLTNEIKSKIERTVKQEDNRIDRVVVTSDPDLVSRIEDMAGEIGQGRPISGFAREINEMLNRIQPR